MHSAWIAYRNAPLAWVQDSLGCALSPPGGRHLSRTGLSCGLNDSIVKVRARLSCLSASMRPPGPSARQWSEDQSAH